jgi:hypothetical protein
MSEVPKLDQSVWVEDIYNQDRLFKSLSQYQQYLISDLKDILTERYTSVRFSLKKNDGTPRLSVNIAKGSFGSSLDIVLDGNKESFVHLPDCDGGKVIIATNKDDLFEVVTQQLDLGIERITNAMPALNEALRDHVRAWVVVQKQLVENLKRRTPQ